MYNEYGLYLIPQTKFKLDIGLDSIWNGFSNESEPWLPL